MDSAVSTEADASPRWGARDWLRALALLVATVAAYFPALRGGLLWDDDGHVTKPALQSLHGLGRIWFELGATQQYYPVLHSAFWVEHRLWGDATLGYHLVNVLGHSLSALLFVRLLQKLLPPAWRGAAWIGGGLFALHPVGVESVAWISEQKNILSTLFYLSAALAYLRFDRTRAPRDYAAAAGCFVLAVLSKTVAATLPAALLVVFWWQRGRLSLRRDVVPLLPALALALAAGLLTAWVERRFIGAHGTEFTLNPLERVLLAGHVAWFYAGKLAWPFRLSFIYPRWFVTAAAPRQYAWVLALLALLAVLWARRRRSRGLLAGVLVFLGSLFPALGFVDVYPFRYSYVADHFQYLASLGLFALVAGGWARWAGGAPAASPGPRRRLARAAALAVMAGLAVLTWRQSHAYTDIDTLYRSTLAVNPRAWLAHNNLAVRLAAEGRPADAVAHYQAALQWGPPYPETYNNLGLALAAAGRLEAALAPFEAALKARPDYADAHYNLGLALSGLGRREEAIFHYRAAIASDPDRGEFHNNLGTALAESGQLPAAITEFAAAVRLQPGNAAAHANLGRAWQYAGHADAAAAEFAIAQRLGAEAPQRSQP
jgi:tetratricopeptide (TPR) repeat protein